MKTVNEKELKEIGLTPADYIVAGWKHILQDQPDTALVCVINPARTGGRGYLLGIATRNENGYQPTTYVLEESNYNVVKDWVDAANRLIYPNRTERETAIIVLSSMRG